MGLLIDMDIDWYIGLVNSAKTKMYDMCHSMEVDIGDVVVTVPFFVMDNLS